MKDFVWCFQMGPENRWRGQRLSSGRTVFAEPPVGQKVYECSLADAKVEGYVFYPPQSGLLRASVR